MRVLNQLLILHSKTVMGKVKEKRLLFKQNFFDLSHCIYKRGQEELINNCFYKLVLKIVIDFISLFVSFISNN